MAKIAAQVILEKLYKENRISFSEEDLVGQTQAAKKVLYTLGAYKNVAMSEEYQHLFGVRELKKLIDKGYNIESMTLYNIFRLIFETEIENIENIFQKSCEDLFYLMKKDNRWANKKLIIAIKSYKKIEKGKDLRLSNFGKVDIVGSYNYYLSMMDNTQYFYGSPFPSVNNIRAISYFPNFITDYFSLERISKKFTQKNLPLMLWIKQNKFPLERYDELQDAIVLDFFKIDLNLKETINILNNMVERNLQLTWRDKYPFDYSKNKNVINKLNSLGLTVPKNGIDLKRQGKRFKNCAGSYVAKIEKGNSLIAYTDNMMIELPFYGGKIRQAYGSINSPVQNESDLLILQNLRNIFE